MTANTKESVLGMLNRTVWWIGT